MRRFRARRGRPSSVFSPLFAPILFLAGLSAIMAPAPPAECTAPSLNMEVLARVDEFVNAGPYSSCWGYTDPASGDEYAIIGAYEGTAFYNIADPSNPTLAGFVNGPPSAWREMKTYRQWCYVVSEGASGGAGVQIISLVDPENPTLVNTYNSTIGRAHTVSIDSVSARLYANGATGGMKMLSLADPVNPVQVGVYSDAYVHDCHVRSDTCYAACISISKIIVLDCTDPAAIDTVTRWSWPGSNQHNCWTTEDRHYLLTTDETSGGKVRSWDISDITDEIQVDEFIADPSADAHNVQIRGNLAYVAHYTEGLQLLDITDPTNMQRVAFQDTYGDGGLYSGAWGVYNYFPSNTIVVSDIQSGLFLIDYWEAHGAVAGVVTSSATAQPIPHAEVVLVESAREFAVDGLGTYTIDADSGSYTLRARAYGFDSTEVSISVAAGDTLAQDFALAPLPGGSISGTVLLGAGGTPLADAVVSFDGSPFSDTTDAAGAFSVDGFPAGTVQVRVDEFLFKPESLLAVVPSRGSGLTFRLESVDVAYNFEDTSAAGWEIDVDGEDPLGQGAWVRKDPKLSTGWDGTPVQPGDDFTRDPLTECWVTGVNGNGPPSAGDVDNGQKSLYSPIMDLTNITEPIISFRRWFSNNVGPYPNEDEWRAQISSDGGSVWTTVDSLGTTVNAWTEVRFRVADFVTPTSTVRMRFLPADNGNDSVVEAGIDDFRVWGEDVVAVGAPDPATAGETIGSTGAAAPFAFRLHPSHPNPILPGQTAELRFDLPSRGEARLEVFGVDGRRVAEVASGIFPAGTHSVRWNGTDPSGRRLASGIYLYRLTAGARHASRKVLLID